MTDDVYDSDDACNRSPPPEPQIVKYGTEDPLPPFVKKHSPSPSGGGDSSSDQENPRKRRQPKPSQGDAVLLGYLDPNRPDIANAARERPLVSESQSEDEREPPIKLKQKKTEDVGVTQATSQAGLGQTAAKALSLLNSDEPQQQGYCGDPSVGVDNAQALEQGRKEQDVRPPPAVDNYIKREPISPRPEQPHNLGRTSENRAADDLLSTSPLRKFAITASEGSSHDVLPALQSPPHSASANSPENTQNLPSLQSALGAQLSEAPPKDHTGRVNGVSPHPFPPLPGSSPPLPRNVLGPDRQLPAHFPPQMPSPYSHVSPASSKDMSGLSPPGSQPYNWRPLKPDIPYMTSPYDNSAHGAQTSEGPATSYPTPTEQKVGGDPERPTFTVAPGQSNAPAPVGAYKCPHPGCTASFQTQYLLK